MPLLDALKTATREAELARRFGVVRAVSALSIEAEGPDAALGEICQLRLAGREEPIRAEVVGLRHGSVILMPYGGTQGLTAGCPVEATGETEAVPVGKGVLGRVIDSLGRPIDGNGPLAASVQRVRLARSGEVNPMHRPRIAQVLETGIRAVDALLTLGRGQRVGIFAGSGVGKSTLLGMIAQHVSADVNVIALIGERGREVREFVDKHLGAAGLARSVVVVATADRPALHRVQAAYTALTLAESFRDEGLQVVLTMDSLTRFAMARREIGLSAGEPPTARGYTPSVFAELPQLCERAGTARGGGSITALLTVLVEGDDPNEPVADALRATLDGHIVLSRDMANRAHFPAIDVLQSVSRVMPDVVSHEERSLALRAISVLALLEKNRELVDLGAYVPGTNPALDAALEMQPRLLQLLQQSGAGASRRDAIAMLASTLGEAR